MEQKKFGVTPPWSGSRPMEPLRAAGWCNPSCLTFWHCFLLDMKESSVRDLLPQRHHFSPLLQFLRGWSGRCRDVWEVLGSRWSNLTGVYWLFKPIHHCRLSTSQIFKSFRLVFLFPFSHISWIFSKFSVLWLSVGLVLIVFTPPFTLRSVTDNCERFSRMVSITCNKRDGA